MKWFTRRSAKRIGDGYSLVDHQLAVVGNVSTDGTVRVEGRLEGTQHRAGKLIIGANATVVGEIEAHEVIIAGTLSGDLRVDGRVEVKRTATVNGDINAAAVMLEDGGTVHGHLVVWPRQHEAVVEPERRIALTPSHAAAALSQG